MPVKWIAILTVLCAAGTASVGAAGNSAPADYREALAQEQALHAVPDPPVTQYESAIRAYENIVRRYPTSGYSDNALWQAAGLSRDLFTHTGERRQLERAARFLRALVSEYPASTLVPAAVLEVTRLMGSGAPQPSRSAAPVRPPPAPAAAPVPVTPHRDLATITAITRVVLPDVVRVIVELDAEVPFHHEQIENPSRVFVDLQDTQVSPAVRGAGLSYDEDIVRQVRIGRQPGDTTRVVLDVQDMARYSYFVLYEPFRVVIDCERPKPLVSAAAPLPEPERERLTAVLPAADVVSPQPAISPSTVHTTVVEPQARAATPADAPLTAPAPPPPTSPPTNAQGGFSIARQLGLGASRIVIDPGHGGHDPGALSHGLSEAEVVMDIALRLEKLLLAEPATEVILTRRSDAYVPLEERTAIANREGADLFLSIHANASADTKTRGIETYFLNLATTAHAEAVAARENSASARRMGNLPDIIRAITLNNKLDESRDFAALVQRTLFQRLRTTGMRDLGVKQAPFVVLIGAEMPSILAEIAFVSNRQDQLLLKKEAYRQRIAEALFAGIVRYQQTLKSTPATIALQ
jgi:N-acetylmuramoyl-L-alanine amidase